MVAYLGELTANELDGWTQFCSHLDWKAQTGQQERTLFDPPRRDESSNDEPLLVKLSSIRLERIRDFGDVWLAWSLWRMLGLEVVPERLIEPVRESVSWAMVAAILVIGRFCKPSSWPTRCGIRRPGTSGLGDAQAVLLHRLGLTLLGRLEDLTQL